MKRFVSVLLGLLCSMFAMAGVASLRYLTNADGLSNSSVNVVFQDSRGLMWFGTWDGLNAWNGRHFRVYAPDPADPSSLCNNIIRQIAEDDKGFLWIATDRGIDRYDPFRDRFVHFFTVEAESIASEKAFHLYVRGGDVYATVEGAGSFRFDGTGFSGIPVLPAGLLSTCIFPEGRKPAIRAPGRFNAACAYEDGLLVATDLGLYRYASLASQPEAVLEGFPVLSVMVGTQGIVWAGTDMRGVVAILPHIEEFHTVKEGFGGAAVRCFAKDAAGTLYVGTKGHGIVTFSADGRRQGRLTTADGLPDNAVYSLVWRDGVLWAGTDGEGIAFKRDRDAAFSRYAPDSLLHSVYSLRFTRDGRLLAATSGGGLFVVRFRQGAPVAFDRIGAEKLGSAIVYSALESADGTIWAGTRGSGLCALAPDGGLRTYREVRDVLYLEGGLDGTLWAGTSSGIARISASGDSLRCYTRDDGLPGNTVHSILACDDGEIWAATSHGLCRISASGKELVSYAAQDGLQDNEFSDGACLRDGLLLYFGGIQGFSFFDPADIERSGYDPPLLLNGFFIDNERTDMLSFVRKGVLTLPPGQGTFSFSFVPLDYVNSHRCELTYRLDGYNKDWVRIGASSDAVVFSNVPPGRYTLKVRCTNADGALSPQQFELPLRVRPAWYASPLAYLLYLLLAVSLVWQLVRFSRFKAERQTLEDIHEGKLRFFTSIAHEFSNSLTLIYGPCEQLRQDGKLSASQKHFVDTIEFNSERMQSLIKEMVLFRKAEAGHLQLNILPLAVDELVSRCATLFRDRLEESGIALRVDGQAFYWNTDRKCLEKIVFNLISNAVKYTPAGGEIIVTTARKGIDMELVVTNTKVGLSEAELKRIFDRYEVLRRFEKEISRGHVSHGIGLPLCKHLTEALGGTIVPESDGSNYVSFRVRLPWQEATGSTENEVEAPEAPIREIPQSREPEAGQREILVVDDDASIRSFLADLFCSRFHVLEASDGAMALEMMAKRQPVLIVSDVMMDGMDGNHLLRAVKDNPATRHIPFILLSARNSLDNQIEGIENGADAYIGKPFNPRHLVAVADRLLGQGQVLREYSESAYAAVQQFEGALVLNEDRELITRVTDFIISNMDNEALCVDDIAADAAVSKMKLYRKLKELVGMSPTEYIRHIRLENAARLLKTTGKTVQEIIYACGFSSKTWFYREFLKKYNVKPNQYRK